MFKLKKPCKDCPFLKNSSTPLHPDRLPSIVEDLHNDSVFYCHKTIDYKNQIDEEGECTHYTERNQFCAGAMIFLEKQNMPNQMMRIGGRLRQYNYKEILEHKDLVIDDLKERAIINY
jgi:hypothetical protein